MKQNEIRVGNWLNDPRPFNEDTKKFFKMTDNGYFKVTARDIQFAEEYKPIPLTEEILLKCRFKKDTKGVLVLNKNIYSLILWGGEVSVYLKIDESVLSIEINYLHQLQNLYFALTGQELEINL